MQQIIVSIAIFLFSGMLALVFGQTPAAVKPTYITGDFVSAAESKLIVSSPSGPIDVIISDKTTYKKVAAENPNFAAATAAVLGDMKAGDKLTVSVVPGEAGKSTARTVYFISKADLAAKNAKESAEWQRRGVMGKVTAVNAATNQITLESRNLTATTSIVITPKDGAIVKRYAPDSVRYDQALDSTVSETKVGDMLRALGDKSSDGSSFAAEQIITGAFQTVAGTVKSVDPASNQIVIKNLQTGKDVTIMVSETSVLKRFPAEQAEMLARVQMMGAGGARPMGQRGGGAPGAGRPTEAPTTGAPGAAPGGAPGQGRPGMNGGLRGAGGIDDILERSPNIGVADLKAGDVIALSSTKTSDDSRLKAIKLFAGVEPFLRAAQAGQGGRRGGVEAGFNIPGLDGMDFP